MHSLILRVALELLGALIVLFTLREVFRDIFHPTSSGTLSDLVSDLVGLVLSRLLRTTRFRHAVGALALVSAMAEVIVDRVTHNPHPYTPEEVFRSFAEREQ